MRLAAALVALAGLLPSGAAAGDCLPWFAEERLETLCRLGKLREGPVSVGEAARLDHLMAAQGYRDRLGLVPAPRNPGLGGTLLPTLGYASDVNGGNPRGELVLGDLVFEPDPDREQRGGVLVGASAGLAGRAIWGEGRHVDLRLAGGYAHAPRLGIGIATASGGVCARTHLRAWWYADLCGDVWMTRRDLSDDEEAAVSLSGRRLFSSGPRTHHDAGLTIRRRVEESLSQTQVSLAASTIHPGSVYSTISVTLGEAVEDRLALRWAAAASLGVVVAERPLTAFARHEVQDGARLLGFARRDERSTLGLSVALAERVTLSLSYSWTDSSIDYFSEAETAVALQVTPIRF